MNDMNEPGSRFFSFGCDEFLGLLLLYFYGAIFLNKLIKLTMIIYANWDAFF